MSHTHALAGSSVHSRLLVLVELSGGNDGLNTVVPYTDSTYYLLRPTLAITRDVVLPLDSRHGLHPSLAPLMPLWRRGEVAILQGIGYPGPSLSHFRSMGIWNTASGSGYSWLSDWLTRALGSTRGQMRFSPDGQCPDPVAVACGNRTVGQPSTHILRGEFPPGDFGHAVRATCEALAGGTDVQVIRLALGGFDTHQNQAPRHATILSELSNGLIALRAGLMELGRWDSTLVLTYSEFGRRVAENPLAGTDHGTAAAHFAFGGRVRGGLYGKAPDLSELDENGNLAFGLDFRAIYATVLERWLGVPAFRVLGQCYETDNFLRA